LGVPASISARNQSMAYSQAAAHKARTDPSTDFDAIIIGAGVSGLYQLYKLRELGLQARVFEAGTGVGGTWYWNRYPGARFDSESWTYGYSFSQELLEEWDWEEHFAGQPETERYLNYVADKSICGETFSSRAALGPRTIRRIRAAGASSWKTAGTTARGS
jgi:cation diffusion facilitator CzcD-associated flavoprotein CzcO